MDVNDLRVIATVVSFVTFLVIVWWACARRNQAAFEQAARIPFEQD